MLDIKTLYFSSALGRAAFLVIFLVTLLGQPRARYLHHWTAALLASTLASLIIINYHASVVLPPLPALIIYTLFLLSLVGSWSGIRLFYGRALPVLLLILLTSVPAIAYVVALAVGVPNRFALPIIFLSAAFSAGMVLVEIVNAPDRRLISQYVVGFGFACYFLVLLLPALLIPFGLIPADVSHSGQVPMIFDQVSSILVYFGYIAMAGERANLGFQRLAESDPLTDLSNRRGGRQLLEQLHLRLSQGASCSVVIGDIDHFKDINDTLGHDAGDTVLIALAERLKSSLRNRDRAVRWGGEEFLIVLPDTGIDEAELFAERLRVLIESVPFDVDQQQLTVTLSLGAAEMVPADPSFESVILRADQALYRAKHEGRNRVCRF